MKKYLRVYMHPDAETYVDIGLPENGTLDMGAWWNAVKKDGAALAEGAMIPTGVIHHVELIGHGVLTPTLTVFPGGKPN